MDDDSPLATTIDDAGPDIALTDVVGASSEDDGVVAMLHAVSWLLRQTRKNRGWTAAEVAKRCRVSPSVLSRAELSRREPTLWLVLTVCQRLGIRFSDLMRMAEDEAFPIGREDWAYHPADLISHPVQIPRSRAAARGGVASTQRN
jgi:transcriptional regulator with XRE-family HTH domain